MSEKTDIVEDAIKITSVIRKHVDEDPECKHTIKEIAAEAFEDN